MCAERQKGRADDSIAALLHSSYTAAERKQAALLLEVARRYYVQGQSQAEIAQAVSFSRPTVSRLLASARRRGVVKIQISHPLERVLSIEEDLVRTFGLKQARVADPIDASAAQQAIARYAADLVVENSSEDVVLSVSNGLAVTATVDAMPPLVWPRSRAIQMIGSVGESDLLLDSPETCRRMARKLGGSFHPLPAPLIVSDETVAESLRSNNQISTTLELGARADIALVGVGATTEGRSGLILRSYETPDMVQELMDSDSVAHLCGHHISSSGEHVWTRLCPRTIAVDIERLREIPLVIGVAWGEHKVRALTAAMRGKFISALVTDRATALRLLDLAVRP
mgnify:CR=1 FL=1